MVLEQGGGDTKVRGSETKHERTRHGDAGPFLVLWALVVEDSMRASVPRFCLGTRAT